MDRTPTGIFRLAPYGSDGYPQGSLVVSLCADRTLDGRRRWTAAIAWRETPADRPKIVYDAIVCGQRQWDQHDTDPGDAALIAVEDATTKPHRVDGVAPSQAMYAREPFAAWWPWVMKHGDDVRAHVDAVPGIYALMYA